MHIFKKTKKYFSSFEAGNCVSNSSFKCMKNTIETIRQDKGYCLVEHYLFCRQVIYPRVLWAVSFTKTVLSQYATLAAPTNAQSLWNVALEEIINCIPLFFSILNELVKLQNQTGMNLYVFPPIITFVCTSPPSDIVHVILLIWLLMLSTEIFSQTILCIANV